MPGNGAAASYGDLLITSLVVLAGVCIAAYIVVKVVGRFLATGRMRGGHLLDIVARLPLEPRRSLYVVEVAGKTLLVGTSEMGLSVLSELDGNEVKARAVPKQSFGELVRSAWMKRRSSAETPSDSSVHAGTASDSSALVGAKKTDVAIGMTDGAATSAHVGAKKTEAATSGTKPDGTSSSAHVGAKTSDGSAETRDAKTSDSSAEARGTHVGAKSDSSASDTTSDSTAHVGAKTSSAETRGLVGTTDREES